MKTEINVQTVGIQFEKLIDDLTNMNETNEDVEIKDQSVSLIKVQVLLNE